MRAVSAASGKVLMKRIPSLTLGAGLISVLILAATAPVASAQGKRPADLSGASAKEVPPIHMFDNLWYVGSSYVSSYILKTSAGLIMIDSNYGDFPPKTVEAMAARRG